MEPGDAVRAWVSRPAVAATTTRADPSGWVARTYTGGSAHEAKADSLHILRQKVLGARALVAVEYEDQDGHSLSYVCGALENDDATWTVTGAAGASRDGHPPRPEPWANLGGWGNQRFLCAGGRVHGDGVSLIRLVGADGQAIEDIVAQGYALLIGDLPFGESYTVELFDAAGQLLATHRWGGSPAS